MWSAVRWNEAIKEAETFPTRQSRELLKDILLKLPLADLNRLTTGAASNDAEKKLKRAAEIQNKMDHGTALVAFGIGVATGAIIPAAIVYGFYRGFKAIQKKKTENSDPKTFPLLFTMKLAEIMELAEMFESEEFKQQLLVAFVTFTKRPTDRMVLRKETRTAEIWFEDFVDRVSDIQVRFKFLKNVFYQVNFSTKQYNDSDPIYDIVPTLSVICTAIWEYIITEMHILQADLKPPRNQDGDMMYIPLQVRDFYEEKVKKFKDLRDIEYKYWLLYLKFAIKLQELNKLKTNNENFISLSREVDAMLSVLTETMEKVGTKKTEFYTTYGSKHGYFIPSDLFLADPAL